MAKKVPKSATSKADSKIVKIPEQRAHLSPSWKFSSVDKNGPYKWPQDDPGLVSEIIKKLSNFDSMKWLEISGEDHHSIPRSSLSKEAQQRLEQLELDDIDEIFSFHFNGRKRIFGILDLSAVKLLWWDEDHKVCPSKLKNT